MKDSCCALCRGPHGKCLTAYKCDHHRAAVEDKGLAGRPAYRDPTGDEAARHIDDERYAKKRKEKDHAHRDRRPRHHR